MRRPYVPNKTEPEPAWGQLGLNSNGRPVLFDGDILAAILELTWIPTLRKLINN